MTKRYMRFRTFFLVFLLAELISYAGYFFPALNIAGFFVIVAAALVFSMRRLEYGLYFVLADLILGGKSGALFSFQYQGFFLSLRMALFIIVMGVWAGKVVASRFHNATQQPSPGLRPPSPSGRGEGEGFLKWWILLGLAIAWGIIRGLMRGNNFGDLFLDANGYLYAAMVLPFWWVIYGGKASGAPEALPRTIRAFTTVFFAATTLLALKTLFAVYWFTHAGNNLIGANLVPFYRWVRDTGVGEITWLPGNFARVFFQSHIYNLVAFFVLLATIPPLKVRGVRGVMSLRHWILLILNTSVILVSLSRSFWVGTLAGLGVLVVVMWRTHNPSRPPLILKGGGVLFAAILTAVLLLLAVARFPLPRPSPANLQTAAESRLEAGDAGQSRWNLLPPLTKAALVHPIIGSGFGTRVTYISNDPRIREVNPTGEYSTTAFEWGWVDLWLKMGILGIIAYVGLLIALARQAIRLHVPFAVATIAALAAIHVFTPYLNHPLGFGILILMTIIPLVVPPKAG